MKVDSSGLGEQPPHLPVLYHEIMNILAPTSSRVYIDGTLGAGGHAQGILEASAPKGKLLGLDLDTEALKIAQRRLAKFGTRVLIRKASYAQAAEIASSLGWKGVDGIILDLGVSSMQIDQPQRGFSFQKAGPLDMRFDPETGRSAADLVNNCAEAELSDIIWRYGEERFSRRIASAITKARPIYRTEELAALVRKVIGNKRGRIDPSTRTFQALRIAVNQELNTLEKALPKLIKYLIPGGMIAIIAFHSLEDRIVKSFFRYESRDCICPPDQPICTCQHVASLKILTPHPIRPSDEEASSNPRARSARLRVAQKL